MFVCLFIHLFIHSCSHVQVVYHVYIVELHLANNCFPLSSFYSTLTFFRTYFGLGQFPHLWFSMETLQDCLWWDLLQAGQPYLTLVHPASRWLHWAMRWCHSALSFCFVNQSTLIDPQSIPWLVTGVDLRQIPCHILAVVQFYFYARELAIAHISHGNSVCLSVCLSVLVSRPGTDPSPGELENSGFHHMIAWSV